MTFEEIYKYCSEYPGLKCVHEDGGRIIVYDNIFNNGWDYFMTNENFIGFYPNIHKTPSTGAYSTSNLLKTGKYENNYFDVKGNDVVGLTQERLKEYLDRLSKSIKKLKQKIRKDAIKKDFVK